MAELDLLTFPDPEEFRNVANSLRNWESQYRDDMRSLGEGFNSLQENWQGDGATAFSQVYAKMQQLSGTYLQQNMRAGTALHQAAQAVDDAKETQRQAVDQWNDANSFLSGFVTGLTLGFDNQIQQKEHDAQQTENQARQQIEQAETDFEKQFQDLTSQLDSPPPPTSSSPAGAPTTPPPPAGPPSGFGPSNTPP